MSNPLLLLDGVLNAGRVRRKSNNTRDLRSKADRVSRGAPEVMVKITGFGKGADHIQAHLTYISRNAKLEIENERGEILKERAELKEYFAQWTNDFSDSRRRVNQRDTMHMVLSMPEGTPDEAVRHAARAFAQSKFQRNHEYVFVLHTDAPHPHVHLSVKMLGFDGSRLNPRRADLQEWREGFAQEMRDQGVDAEATPRSARGVVRKAENTVVRHIERGDVYRAPRTSKVKALRVKAVVEELFAENRGEQIPPKPWEPRIENRQKATRGAWCLTASELEKNTTSLKDHTNERPNYEKLNAARVRSGQRAAALYQSNLERLGHKISAAALARLRNMSRLPVVQHERPAQVLLLAHASDRVGRHGTADHDLRRSRTGFASFAGGSNGRVVGVGRDTAPEASARRADRPLAKQIRAFVDVMPSTETQHEQLKRSLATKFARPVEVSTGKSVDARKEPASSPAARVTTSTPTTHGHDLDR